MRRGEVRAVHGRRVRGARSGDPADPLGHATVPGRHGDGKKGGADALRRRRDAAKAVRRRDHDPPEQHGDRLRRRGVLEIAPSAGTARRPEHSTRSARPVDERHPGSPGSSTTRTTEPGQTVRPIEVGRRDNRVAIERQRRDASSEKNRIGPRRLRMVRAQKATVGCLMLQVVFNDRLAPYALEQARLLQADINELSRRAGQRMPGQDRPVLLAARKTARRAVDQQRATEVRVGSAAHQARADAHSLRRSLPMSTR